MRELFYRMSWDVEFKQKFIKWCCIGSLIFACLLALVVILIGNLSNNEEFQDGFVRFEEDTGEIFNLEFTKKAQTKKEDDRDNNDTNEDHAKEENHGNDNSQSQSHSNAGGSETGDRSGSGGGFTHVHNWYRVVDSQAWDEEYWVQTGTKFVCNSCGYSCMDANAASLHSKQTGHKFRTEGIMERRVRHHAEISHEECSCGARR